MQENNLPIETFQKNQQLPELFSSLNKKTNYWKLGFFITLTILLFSLGVLIYFIKSKTKLSNQSEKSNIPNNILITPSVVPSVTQQQSDVQNISVKIDPYRLDDKDGQIIATFQITNLNKENSISKITHWTDKNGACKAETESFSEFIEISENDIIDYVFFQFTDKNGNISEIYATSPSPIFQCGKLAE